VYYLTKREKLSTFTIAYIFILAVAQPVGNIR
jgi:hypothetical protein